jgi:MYXO-CTERM domain-containing protein
MVFVGTDGGVFYTCNDGVKWVRLGQALPNTVVVDVRYDVAFKRVVASTMGRGVWSIEEPAPATCDSDAGIGAGGAAGAGGAGGASGGGIDGGGAGGAPTGAGGQGGAVGSGGNPTGSGGAVGAGGIDAGGTTSVGGNTGASGGPGPSSGQDSGCGCRVTGRADGAALGLSLLGLAMALWGRRRSRSDQNPQT